MTGLYLAALLIGIVAGLRAMTPLAVLSWAAFAKCLLLEGTWASFLASLVVAIIATVLAAGEIVNDKLPKTPSRKAPPAFAARVVLGAFYGAVFGTLAHDTSPGLFIGLVLGAIGAVIGTLGGAWARGALATVFGKDLPAALIEDVITVAAALAITAGLAT
ncbi:putative integral membrane protein [Mycobacteroides abscessus]|nr:putative integral membrane protein [Mycobacteroides abscessus]